MGNEKYWSDAEELVGAWLRGLEMGNAGKAESCDVETFGGEGPMRLENISLGVGNRKGVPRPSAAVGGDTPRLPLGTPRGTACGSVTTVVSIIFHHEPPVLHLLVADVSIQEDCIVPGLTIDGLPDAVESDGENDPLSGRN